MLQDLDKSLEKLLVTYGKINKNEIEIAFDQPTGEWSSRLSRPTLNLWCFDVRLRSMDLQGKPSDKTNWIRMGPPPRRMDVTYLVTAWTRKIEDEHQLIWRALATLKRFSVLSPNDCVGTIREQQGDMPFQVCDLSDRQLNLVDLWSVLDNQMHLGFTVVVTIELDLQIAFESPLVLEPLVRVGVSSDPRTGRLDEQDVEFKMEDNKQVSVEALARVLTELGYEIKPINGKNETEEG
jgi:hypothetical protein